jgi:hypothetical protein
MHMIYLHCYISYIAYPLHGTSSPEYRAKCYAYLEPMSHLIPFRIYVLTCYFSVFVSSTRMPQPEPRPQPSPSRPEHPPQPPQRDENSQTLQTNQQN